MQQQSVPRRPKGLRIHPFLSLLLTNLHIEFHNHAAATRPHNRKKGKEEQMGLLPAAGESLTGLGDEEKQHDDGGDERDDAAGERPLVEVLVHLGVRVQPLEPLQERVHLSSCYSDTGARRQHPRSLANPT
jgi:hypothetical protein